MTDTRILLPTIAISSEAVPSYIKYFDKPCGKNTNSNYNIFTICAYVPNASQLVINGNDSLSIDTGIMITLPDKYYARIEGEYINNSGLIVSTIVNNYDYQRLYVNIINIKKDPMTIVDGTFLTNLTILKKEKLFV